MSPVLTWYVLDVSHATLNDGVQRITAHDGPEGVVELRRKTVA